jgi:hypothetical protein
VFAATSQSPVTPSSVAALLLAAKERNWTAETALLAHAARRLRLTERWSRRRRARPQNSPELRGGARARCDDANAPPQLNAPLDASSPSLVVRLPPAPAKRVQPAWVPPTRASLRHHPVSLFVRRRAHFFALLSLDALSSLPMPSFLHEALIQLFKNRPELAPEILRDVLSLELPAYSEVRVESADLTQLAPTELHADLVVLLIDGKPVLGIVVEVQLQRDERKKFTWPLYMMALRARLECNTCVLVVTPSTDVARWAAEPIFCGPGFRVQPLVLGPDAVPIVVDADEARAAPELAVLSAMAHGKDSLETAVQVAMAAATAAHELDRERWLLYFQMIRAALSEAARKAFQMLPQGAQFFDESLRQSFDKGRAEGRAAEKAADVLDVLDARGLTLSSEQRERILSCADLNVLKTWLRRAVTVATVDELFV